MKWRISGYESSDEGVVGYIALNKNLHHLYIGKGFLSINM